MKAPRQKFTYGITSRSHFLYFLISPYTRLKFLFWLYAAPESWWVFVVVTEGSGNEYGRILSGIHVLFVFHHSTPLHFMLINQFPSYKKKISSIPGNPHRIEHLKFQLENDEELRIEKALNFLEPSLKVS